MRRSGIFPGAAGAIVVGLIFLLAPPARAQQPPAFTVTFGGEMRVHGILFDNMTDFTDTEPDGKGGSAFKDSNSHYFQRWRLRTTVESADKKAKAHWALEVGDIVWGAGGGASGGEFTGTSTRVGPGTGGQLGNDGVNVETKNLYVQFDIPFVPGANLLLGLHNIIFLESPIGAFMDDDAAGIQFNWKLDPVRLQLWTAKADENNRQDADDVDFYVGRLMLDITKDLRVSVEGLLVNQQCFAKKSVTTTTVVPGPTAGSPATTGTTTARTGACVDADIGDTYWVGGTVSAKIATVQLDGTVVYGQRALFSDTLDRNIDESGWGAQVTARVPIGPLSTWWNGWYTTGDENRIVGSKASKFRSPGTGQDFSTNSPTTKLNADSDKLPIPIASTSWLGAPFQSEFVLGIRTLGVPFVGSSLYLDPTGTWGVGGSAIYALTPAVSVGGGVGYVAAIEDNGIFGDNVIEVDGGLTYAYNPNLGFQLIAGYLIPDEGDDAWAAMFRTRFAF